MSSDCSVQSTEKLTRAAIAVSIAKAGCSVRGFCTADTVASCVTRLLVWLRFVVTRLVVSVEGPWAGACGTELNNDVFSGVTPERRLALPRIMLLVGVVALTITITPRRRAFAFFGVLDVHLHTTADKGAERRVLRTDIVVAVNSTEVVPKVVLTGNEIVLHLNDSGRCDPVVWQIAKLYRDTAVS